MTPAPQAFCFDCRVCGGAGKLAVDYKQNRDGRWAWLIDCWVCPSGGYLRALADVVGAPSGAHLKADPLAYLGPPIGVPRARTEPEEAPSSAMLDGARSRLAASREVMLWLARRGIRRTTVERYRLGYMDRHGHGAVVIPAWRRRRLVGVRYRYYPAAPPRRRKYDGLAGWPADLYPNIRSNGTLVLGEGEFDVLVTRQHGIRTALTTTCGAVLPDRLIPRLTGRRVAVIYDVGKEDRADQTAQKLRDAGIDAWAVPLGLPREGDDLSDWYVRYGRSSAELRELIRRGRTRTWG